MKKGFLLLFTLFIIISSVACSQKADIDDFEIRVGASPVPHSAILEVIREELLAKGYTLKIVEFTDYVLPNTSLDARELDANFFQHLPYLTFFNESNKTNLVSAGAIQFEPLGIYQGTLSTLENIPLKTKVAIPNDQTNRARALLLLESEGLITLKEGANLQVTSADITENPYQLEIIELEAAGIPARLADVGLAVVNGNYALNASITNRLLRAESNTSLAATTYANIVVVRKGDETKPAIQVLMEVLQSEKVRNFIIEQYSGVVFPLF